MNEDFENSLSKTWGSKIRKDHPSIEDGFKNHHRSSYGGDWEFNEIIGYIKLFFFGSQVRGEYWSTKPQRKVRTRRKEFEYKAHKLVAESKIWNNTNEGILSAIEDYLSRCQSKLTNRHVDLREFEVLKNHIDWISLHKANNEFEQ